MNHSADLRAPVVMGILNLTPDSFSDGIPGATQADFLRKAETLMRDGADILDIGAESTRPGAEPVATAEEIGRLRPFLKLFRAHYPAFPLSLDTRKFAVAETLIGFGIGIINDTSFLADSRLAELAKAYGIAYVLMHSRGTPQTMAGLTDYAGELPEALFSDFLARLGQLLEIGLSPRAVILDPGFGFAKTSEQCRLMMARLPAWHDLRREAGAKTEADFPLMLGISRKRFLQLYTGENAPEARDAISAELAAHAYRAGFRIVRTHNVALHKGSYSSAIRRMNDP